MARRLVIQMLTAAGIVACPVAVRAQVAFDWVTIGAPGNAAYDGPGQPVGDIVRGRGQVDYEYRIARTETTTAQWLEFVNTFTTQPDPSFGLEMLPTFWGATRDFDYTGPGYRWQLSQLPQAAMLPVVSISWRDAAYFCNWLQNGKPSNLSEIQSGAYDTSTWGRDGRYFTDAPTHLPGANYWIPTLDEWVKAAHYDPNRYGKGQGGYWQFPNASDDLLVPGPPGIGMTSTGYEVEEPFEEWRIPLGAYPESQSPWGLLDLSGGTHEWTEEIVRPGAPTGRALKGSYAGPLGTLEADRIIAYSSVAPDGGFLSGLRIVSAIPSPGLCALSIAPLLSSVRRRRL